MQLAKVPIPTSFLQYRPPIPIPRSLFLFSCASLLGTFLLFPISMLDLGYLSMWLNPSASIFTIVYHAGVFLIARRKRKPDSPSYFSTVVFSAYLLSILWLVAFILTIVMFAPPPNLQEYSLTKLKKSGLPANAHTQKLQAFLAFFEMCIILGMAIKGHAIVGKEGPDPPDWRHFKDNETGTGIRF